MSRTNEAAALEYTTYQMAVVGGKDEITLFNRTAKVRNYLII